MHSSLEISPACKVSPSSHSFLNLLPANPNRKRDQLIARIGLEEAEALDGSPFDHAGFIAGVLGAGIGAMFAIVVMAGYFERWRGRGEGKGKKKN